jgi:myo-inositol 2-dehydrogenase/D-chiro-inositol 1-dehydrogenase
MRETVGVGIIGCGFMGLTYAEVLARHVPGARLAAVTGGTRAPQLAREYEVPAAGSVEALLARSDVDAVIVATPDQFRCEITLQAAAAGKHLLVEKPMAPTVAECDRMLAACAAAGVNLAVVKTERYRKITQQAKRLIDDGVLGPLWMLRTISSFPITLTREISESRQWMAQAGSGGLFLGIATHNADFLRWLTNANAVQVFAQARTFSDLPATAQSVMAQIAFDNGALAHLWISAEFPGPGIPSSEVRFQVVGRDAILDLENFEYLDITRDGKWERLMTPERFDYLKEPKSPIRLHPHIGVVSDFIASVREGCPPRVGGAEGRAAVEICEACLRSSQTGQAVTLPLPGTKEPA